MLGLCHYFTKAIDVPSTAMSRRSNRLVISDSEHMVQMLP